MAETGEPAVFPDKLWESPRLPFSFLLVTDHRVLIVPRSILGLTMERRREPRFPNQLVILVWGIDAKGEKFAQLAQACNISERGARLSGIEHRLRPEDLIGVQYRERRAKFRVVWLRDTLGPEKTLAAVERLEAEACPWQEELSSASHIRKAPHPEIADPRP